MIFVKSAEQLTLMRHAGMVLYEVLCHLCEMVKPGITTAAIDEEALRLIRKAGCTPSFLGYRGYPASVCLSPDDVVVHGIPGPQALTEGSILSLDCGVIWQGYHADSARTVPVGAISEAARKLIAETERCFWLGANQARAGARISDVSWAVESHARANGYGVVRDLCGHGVGKSLHEDPEVPNFGPPGRGVRLRPGMTIAVEPMIVQGRHGVSMDAEDGWTVRTLDGGWCAHYEHSIAILPEGPPEILTLPKDCIPEDAWTFAGTGHEEKP